MNSAPPLNLSRLRLESSTPAAGELLPHEVVFGAFLLVTWLRFVVRLGIGSADALQYAAFLILNVVVVAACWQRESLFRWRIRLLYYAVTINVIYLLMKGAIPRLATERFDSALNSIDTAAFGATPALLLQSFQGPVLSECFSLCYLLFYPYFFFSLIFNLLGDLGLARRFASGLFVIYGIGFIGYSLVPAAGPHLALAPFFAEPVPGGWITGWNAALVKVGSNRVDVFPSLHCAVSAFILFFDRRFRPVRFRWALIPCIGLWGSTMYLGYHYAVDVICGFALAAVGLFIAFQHRYAPSQLYRESGDRLKAPAISPPLAETCSQTGGQRGNGG